MAENKNDKGELLSKIQDSIVNMQGQFKKAYEQLSHEIITGESKDKTMKIIITATQQFRDCEMVQEALVGGFTAFRARLKEALEDLFEKLTKTTQTRTLSMLQNMPIPDEIKDLPLEKKENDENEE
jgi:DNA-binding protein YbaB